MMAQLSAAGLMIRISTSCRWWWSHRFGPRFHGSLVGGDVGRRMVLGKMAAPFRIPTPSCYLHARNSTVADWRAHLDMGVHNRPGLQEAHPTHPMACATVRLFEKSFNLQSFINARRGCF